MREQNLPHPERGVFHSRAFQYGLIIDVYVLTHKRKCSARYKSFHFKIHSQRFIIGYKRKGYKGSISSEKTMELYQSERYKTHLHRTKV